MTDLTKNLAEAWDARVADALTVWQTLAGAPALFKPEYASQVAVRFQQATDQAFYWRTIGAAS